MKKLFFLNIQLTPRLYISVNATDIVLKYISYYIKILHFIQARSDIRLKNIGS